MTDTRDRILFSWTLAAALLLGLTAPAARADDKPAPETPGGRPTASFSALDQNHDEAISKAEAAAVPRLLLDFNLIDADGDGRVSRKEYQAWYSSESFQALDVNHDGLIGETEAAFDPELWERFEQADADGNRTISREEFARWRSRNVYHAAGPRLLVPSSVPRVPVIDPDPADGARLRPQGQPAGER